VAKPIKTFVGQRYGARTVTGIAGQDSKGKTLYSFRCDCGYEGIAISKSILHNPMYCKNCKPTQPVDMVGRKTEKWDVISSAGKNAHGAMLFNCRCTQCNMARQLTGVLLRKKNQPVCRHCHPPHIPTPRTDIVKQSLMAGM
jgi:hypothetical protein